VVVGLVLLSVALLRAFLKTPRHKNGAGIASRPG